MTRSTDTQAKILHLIQTTPGIHKSKIQRRLDLGWGTVCFHVARLAADKKIQTSTLGARVHLFAGPTPKRQAQRLIALRQKHAQTLLHILDQRPGSSISSLARATGAARRTIRTRLQDLEKHDLVQSSPPPSVRYALRPGAHEAATLAFGPGRHKSPATPSPISLA